MTTTTATADTMTPATRYADGLAHTANASEQLDAAVTKLQEGGLYTADLDNLAAEAERALRALRVAMREALYAHNENA